MLIHKTLFQRNIKLLNAFCYIRYWKTLIIVWYYKVQLKYKIGFSFQGHTIFPILPLNTTKNPCLIYRIFISGF